jgi:penicillin-binding protein 1A
MLETGQEFRRGDGKDQSNPKKPSDLRREAGSQIMRGFKQLGTALAAEVPGFFRQLVPTARALLLTFKIAVVGLMLAVVALTAAILWALYTVPLEGRKDAGNRPSVLLEAANGAPLGRVGPVGDALRRDEFPDLLVNAVLAIEDRRFYRHYGVDVRGIARAMYANWSAGGVVEGGSTITQQLAKMQLVGAERTYDRKLREALTAIWLEMRHSKDEILTRYLNGVYLGAGAYGMSAAARTYFDKSVAELTLPEAALLAGLIQAPSRYNPARDLPLAQARAATVIDAMSETGVIDTTAAAKAKAEPATLKPSLLTARAGSWFADWIARSEVAKIGGSAERALRVRTTMQPELQQLAERTVNEVLANPEGGRGAGQAALVAMRPDGSVVAMVGGRNYEESEFNRAVDAKRQPGSVFKLFVYYAALRNGYRPETVIDASAIEVNGWEPENYQGEQYGRMTLSDAFARSVNSAAARLGDAVGLDQVVLAARELGLDAPLTKVPSLALGTNEVTLLDLTGAFASVRAGRPKIEPWGITALGQEGSGLRSLGPPSSPPQPLPYQQELTRMLEDVVNRGTGRAAALDGDVAAGKTGTSQDYRDAWFVGFNKALVVGVWVGNDDRAPMDKVTGGSLPAQIWKRFVSAATPLVDRPAAAVAAIPPAPAVAAPASVPPPPVGAQEAADANQVAAEISAAADPAAPPIASASPATSAAPATPDTAATQIAPTASSPSRCDARACAAKYSSFRDSDCTYQPFGGGGRRVCELGGQDGSATVGETTPSQSSENEQTAENGQTAENEQTASGRRCDAYRCARQYRSFDPGTCTYQPYDGGARRFCDVEGGGEE